MSWRKHSQWHCSEAFLSFHRTQPSKKCHPLWSLPTRSKSTFLRSPQLKHATKPLSTNLGHPSLCSSILPSLWLSAYPLLGRNQPVSVLWDDMAACSPLRRPITATKQALRSYWGVLVRWHLERGHSVTKRGTLSKCHIFRQTAGRCVWKRKWLLVLVFPWDIGEAKGTFVGPRRQLSSSFHVMDALTEH